MKGEDNMEKVMLDVRDIMVVANIGRSNAYELMKSGQFEVKKIGNKFLVHKDIFESWLKGEKSPKKKARW
jgi:predicted DNA-binding transcriptional regulator AlpA